MMIIPVLEVGVDHTVGETFTANTDTLKYTVTSQLVHNQVRIDDTWMNRITIMVTVNR